MVESGSGARGVRHGCDYLSEVRLSKLREVQKIQEVREVSKVEKYRIDQEESIVTICRRYDCLNTSKQCKIWEVWTRIFKRPGKF